MPDDAELRALRERAYGPRADIEADAAAVRRLERLQSRGRTGAGTSSDGSPGPSPARAPARHGTLVAVLLAAAAGASLAAVVTATALTVGGAGTGADAVTVVATLREDPALPFPSQLSSSSATLAEGIRYDDYLGVVVVSLPARQRDGSRCLYVLSRITAGALAGGCSAGPFPASVTLTVTADMPADLLALHEAGTALRFELRDREVVVEIGDRYGSGVPPHTAR